MTAVSALSNTSQRSIYNYARRPIPVQLFLVVYISAVGGHIRPEEPEVEILFSVWTVVGY